MGNDTDLRASEGASGWRGSRIPRRRVLALSLLVLFVVTASVSVFLDRPAAPPALGPAPRTTLDGDEAAYYNYVAPRLDALIKQADALVTLSATKSRNVLALRGGQNAVITLLSDLDARVATAPTPRRFTDVQATYEAAATSMRAGMSDTRVALAHLDWDAVTQAAETFRTGAEGAKRARSELDTAAGVLTPTPRGGPVTPAIGVSSPSSMPPIGR